MQESVSFQEKYLDPSQITSKISEDQQSSITCMICLGVVIHPSECKNCETVYCASQVMADGVYKPCPLCKSISWKYGSDIHKSYKSKLSSLTVICNYHQECKGVKYTYEKYITHLENKKIEKPIGKGYYQFCYLEDNEWKPYEESINSAANLYIQDGVGEFRISGYVINISDLIQVNSKTEYKRKIKMELIKNRKPLPLWITEVETSKYQPYGSDMNETLEKAYQEFLEKKRKETVIQVGKYYYTVNYDEMKQINTISKTSRRIKRVMI